MDDLVDLVVEGGTVVVGDALARRPLLPGQRAVSEVAERGEARGGAVDDVVACGDAAEEVARVVGDDGVGAHPVGGDGFGGGGVVVGVEAAVGPRHRRPRRRRRGLGEAAEGVVAEGGGSGCAARGRRQRFGVGDDARPGGGRLVGRGLRQAQEALGGLQAVGRAVAEVGPLPARVDPGGPTRWGPAVGRGGRGAAGRARVEGAGVAGGQAHVVVGVIGLSDDGAGGVEEAGAGGEGAVVGPLLARPVGAGGRDGAPEAVDPQL